MLERVMNEAGARYLTTIRVRDMGGTHKHLLVHATTSRTGVLAMKDAISQALGKEYLPEALRDQLREDLTVSLDPILDALPLLYAGQTVPLARKDPKSLQDDLLVSTFLFPFQCKELKAALKTRGWYRRVSGKECVTFPLAGSGHSGERNGVLVPRPALEEPPA